MMKIVSIEAEIMNDQVYTALEQLSGGVLQAVSGFMHIADEVIESMVSAMPERKNLINDCFQHMWPSDELLLCNSDALYKRHFEEIISRAIQDSDVSKVMNAEALGSLIQNTQPG